MQITLDKTSFAIPARMVRRFIPGQWLAIASFALGSLCFAVSPDDVFAATVAATSCADSQVQTAINNASNGDTVLVPPGSCTWTFSVIIIGKYVTLQGAGAGTSVQCGVPGQTSTTCITDGTPKVADCSRYCVTYMLGVRDAIDGGLLRITGFTFLGGAGPCDASNSGIVNFQTGSTTKFRFDHNKVYTTRTVGMRIQSCVYGVMDHNAFFLTNGNYGHLSLIHIS